MHRDSVGLRKGFTWHMLGYSFQGWYREYVGLFEGFRFRANRYIPTTGEWNVKKLETGMDGEIIQGFTGLLLN